MRVIIAPDSYKGSLSAVDVAEAMARGILRIFPEAEIFKVPIADGGEGTVEALVTATKGQIFKASVLDPLGRQVIAPWGVLGDGKTAVIEMAAASGLPLIAAKEKNPLITSSFGTGELIRTALDQGLRKIIVGIGGSATNDGGMGMLRALGARFFDRNGKDLPEGGAALARLETISLENLDVRLHETEIIVACDVDNPLCGPRGASAVFGPQKGATPAMVAELDAALANYSVCARLATGRDIAGQAGTGAAGGLGAGLMYFTQATLKPGVAMVLESVRFADLVQKADWVITGEGRTDFQTAYGKAPVGVAKIAKQFNVPVFCISGGLGKGADDVLAHGIDAVMSICERPMSLEECMAEAEPLIESAALRLAMICRAVRRSLKE